MAPALSSIHTAEDGPGREALRASVSRVLVLHLFIVSFDCLRIFLNQETFGALSPASVSL